MQIEGRISDQPKDLGPTPQRLGVALPGAGPASARRPATHRRLPRDQNPPNLYDSRTQLAVVADRRDAERGRRFDDEASVVEENPQTGDDRRLLDQDCDVSDQEEVLQDGRDAPRV